MQKLVFTICSNNFLSYAISFANSLIKKNPDYTVVIGLADEISQSIDYSRFAPHTVISMHEVGIPNLQWMTENYGIVELNTAVKPFYFEYLFRTYGAGHILFFDPDIYVYHSLQPLTSHFGDYDVLLTPHVLQPIPREVYPWENHFLNHGIYNLGFIGLKNTANVHSLLKWWQERTAEHCVANYRKGLYVDQLWANLIPLFFERVQIVKDPGLNVAFWNLHERDLSKRNGEYFVNDHPLTFFHFSAFNPQKPDRLTKENYSNIDQSKIPSLVPLLHEYQNVLLENDYKHFSSIPFAYSREEQINTELERITLKIGKAETILGYLQLRLIDKEKLLSYTYQLFTDYMTYNNLQLKNINDDRYNSLEYAHHVRKKIHSHLAQKTHGRFLTQLNLLRWSFKAFWK